MCSRARREISLLALSFARLSVKSPTRVAVSYLELIENVNIRQPVLMRAVNIVTIEVFKELHFALIFSSLFALIKTHA